MNISDILSEDLIIADLECDNKRQLIEKIATFISDKKGVDKNVVFEAIWERENLGSTGYGNGVAFPHASIEGITKVISVFVRTKNAIDFDALDANPVDLFAFVLSPEKSGEDHLQSLAAFSRLLKDAPHCKELRSAKTVHDIYVALN